MELLKQIEAQVYRIPLKINGNSSFLRLPYLRLLLSYFICQALNFHIIDLLESVMNDKSLSLKIKMCGLSITLIHLSFTYMSNLGTLCQRDPQLNKTYKLCEEKSSVQRIQVQALTNEVLVCFAIHFFLENETKSNLGDDQCDQVWRNFAILAKFCKSFSNSREFIQFLTKF